MTALKSVLLHGGVSGAGSRLNHASPGIVTTSNPSLTIFTVNVRHACELRGIELIVKHPVDGEVLAHEVKS